jgi:hypothetical protein
VLASLGTLSKSSATAFGTVFALLNFAYVGMVVAAFAKGRSTSDGRVVPLAGGLNAGTAEDRENEWKEQVRIIDESDNLMPEARKQMIDELGLLRGKVLAEIEKELGKLASRKYKVIHDDGVALCASSDLGSNVKKTLYSGSTITATGTREVDGIIRLLSDKGWASATDAEGDALIKAVSEIDSVALLAGVRKAAASIDLLNADYGRLKADSVAVDFQEFLVKMHVADIVKRAEWIVKWVDWEKHWKDQVRIIDDTENLMPEVRKQLIDELGLLRCNVLTETEKNLTKLAARKYEVVFFGVFLFASSDLESKVKRMVEQGSTITVTGTREVGGSTMLLVGRALPTPTATFR